MTLIWQICGAIFMVAGATIALCVATVLAYAVIVGIQSAIQERKEKKEKDE